MPIRFENQPAGAIGGLAAYAVGNSKARERAMDKTFDLWKQEQDKKARRDEMTYRTRIQELRDQRMFQNQGVLEYFRQQGRVELQRGRAEQDLQQDTLDLWKSQSDELAKEVARIEKESGRAFQLEGKAAYDDLQKNLSGLRADKDKKNGEGGRLTPLEYYRARAGMYQEFLDKFDPQSHVIDPEDRPNNTYVRDGQLWRRAPTPDGDDTLLGWAPDSRLTAEQIEERDSLKKAAFDTVDGVRGQWEPTRYGMKFSPISAPDDAKKKRAEAIGKRADELVKQKDATGLNQKYTFDEAYREAVRQQDIIDGGATASSEPPGSPASSAPPSAPEGFIRGEDDILRPIEPQVPPSPSTPLPTASGRDAVRPLGQPPAEQVTPTPSASAPIVYPPRPNLTPPQEEPASLAATFDQRQNVTQPERKLISDDIPDMDAEAEHALASLQATPEAEEQALSPHQRKLARQRDKRQRGIDALQARKRGMTIDQYRAAQTAQTGQAVARPQSLQEFYALPPGTVYELPNGMRGRT